MEVAFLVDCKECTLSVDRACTVVAESGKYNTEKELHSHK